MIMSDLYTTKTAALKAIKADVSKLKTKNFYINDTKITENDIGFSLPRDYPKLIPDCDFSISEDYMIYDENGVVEHMSFADKIETGYNMFQNDKNIKKFEFDMPNLKYGYSMFYNSDIEKFDGKLDNLINGNSMFSGCHNLSSFETNYISLSSDFYYYLPSLTSSYDMFKETNISDIKLEMRNCTYADGTFSCCPSLSRVYTSVANNCPCYRMFADSINLEAVWMKQGSVSDGIYMFGGCHNLSNFICQSDFFTNIYENSEGMFKGCKLDASSVERILNGLPTVSNGSIDIGISSNASETFGNITGTIPSPTMETTVNYKGWTITVKIND